MVQTGIIFNAGPTADNTGQKIELATGDTAEIKIRFQPNATSEQINRILGSINATIVDGPESGFYEINVSGNSKKLPLKKIQAIVSKLQKEKTIVEYVQENAD